MVESVYAPPICGGVVLKKEYNDMAIEKKKRITNLTIVVLAVIALSFYLGFIYMVNGR